jgi:hypothetical protein
VHEAAETLTVRFDVTPVRAEVSLAVTEGHVVAVYGLDIVEARPAIYVIHPVGVARVDTVVAVAGVHLVVAAAAPEAVGPAVALEVVLPEAALEAVPPARPLRRSTPARPVRRSFLSVPRRVSSPPVPVRTFARASWPAKSVPAVTTISVSKMYSRVIGLPPQSTWSLCCSFSLELSTDTGSRSLAQQHGWRFAMSLAQR